MAMNYKPKRTPEEWAQMWEAMGNEVATMGNEETLCESCAEDDSGEHMCRSNESFCIDGINCPDYQEYCPCQECGGIDE